MATAATPPLATLPDPLRDALERLIQAARDIEPYLGAPGDESVYVDRQQGTWTPSMLNQLRLEIYPYPAAVELLQFAAENAGQEVTYRDFLLRSDLSDTQVRAELGAMSKVARRLFGKKTWPIRTRQASDGVMRYLMPEGIAEWWLGWGATD